METRAYPAAVAALIGLAALAGCSGLDVSGQHPASGEPVAGSDAAASTGIEGWAAWHTIDNDTYIGSGVIERLKLSPRVGIVQQVRHGNTRMYHQRLRAGVGRNRLAAYLVSDAEFYDGEVRRFGDTPPIVKGSYGITDEQWKDVRTAVRMINAALPSDYRIRTSTDRSFRAGDGEIRVSFKRREFWPAASCSGARAIGCASTSWTGSETTRGEVLVDHTRIDNRNGRLSTIIHEILHVMGRGHPDPYRFLDSLMTAQGTENSGFILSQLDREALLAVYGKLEPGTPAKDIYRLLGPWEDTATVVSGILDIDGGDVRFGATELNEHVQAWAYGATPWTSLANNDELEGSAIWQGRLLGMTPQSEVVAGASRLRVQLATLDGNLDFTGLEAWAANAAPGALGTGTTWLDGDLTYPIEVSGNRFWRSTWESGDEGIVNGAFFGIAHEGMGGVLERDDLSAGFGGSLTRRQLVAVAPRK